MVYRDELNGHYRVEQGELKPDPTGSARRVRRGRFNNGEDSANAGRLDSEFDLRGSGI